MGCPLDPHPPAGRRLWRDRGEAPRGVESRSPLPAFKNLGRGVF
jgi:hypothetical protein